MTPGIQVISESREADVDRSVWKIALLGFLGTVASVAAVSGFNRLLLGLDYFYFWPTLVAFVLFVILSVLQIFLVKGLGKLSLIAFFESVAPLALFWGKLYPQFPVVLALGAALSFILYFAAARRGRKVIENSIKTNFFETSKSFLSKIVMGFLLMLSVVLYLNYFEWGNFAPEMGRRLVAETLSASEPVVKIIFPGVSFDVTIRDLLKNLAAEQLRNTRLQLPGVSASSPETDFRALPERDQNKLIDQAVVQLEGVMASRFGSVNPNEKVSDFAYGLVSKYLASSMDTSPWILPAVAILVFFFASKGILMLFHWFFTLLAFLVFKLLILMNFVYYNLETRSREFILLS